MNHATRPGASQSSIERASSTRQTHVPRDIYVLYSLPGSRRVVLMDSPNSCDTMAYLPPCRQRRRIGIERIQSCCPFLNGNRDGLRLQPRGWKHRLHSGGSVASSQFQRSSQGTEVATRPNKTDWPRQGLGDEGLICS